jgi:hypothetical protein
MEIVDMSTGVSVAPYRLGRPPGEQLYIPVTYNNKEYVVGVVFACGDPVVFVFDKEDHPRVSERIWHRCANNYISSGVIVDGKKKELFLHNLVMNRPLYLGKGQTETVDHISRNGFDNRKENLRVVSQTEQNLNQKSRRRTAVLPADCGLTMEDIPRHIWYIKANGAHGDRFAIEFKSEGVTWKTTSSKSVSLCDKLTAAKIKLQEYYTIYPHLNPNNPERLAEIAALRDSYKTIVELAGLTP